jgi:hypothetical protein
MTELAQAEQAAMAAQAVDLDAVKFLAQQRTEADERGAQEKQLLAAWRWEKAMQRLFKGIVSRPLRHANIRRAAERLEAGHELPQSGYKLRAEAPRKRRGPGGGGKRGKR